MSFNGSGTFVINTAGQPVVPNTVISATAFNALTNDLANGLSTCITKDGQTTPTANIPMGNNKITGLAPGTSGTDAANLSQVQGSTAKLLQSVTGTDTITAAMVPALTSYSAGQMFYFVAAGNNTGAVTINIDSLGAKSVTRDGSTALVAGDIVSGEVALIVYDGTRFQLLNGNSFTNLNVSGTLAVGSTSTFTGAATFSAGTANQVQYLNASKVLTGSANLTFDGTTLTANALTLTNNPTLSGGTANGVLYLNGSKVATSGSALTFNGSNLSVASGNLFVPSGVVAVGDTTSGKYLEIYNGTADAQRIKLSMSGTDGVFQVTRSSGTVPNFIFQQDSTELMRLTFTGLGIGTTSPAYKVDSSGQVRALESGTGSGDGGFVASTSGANGNAGVLFQTNSASRWNLTTAGTNGANLRIYNYALASTVATFDSSGNLGLGTASPEAILHVAKSTSGGIGGQLVLDNNASTALDNATEISFLNESGASGSGTRNARIRSIITNAGDAASALQFYTWNGSTDAERGRFTAGGYFKASNSGTYVGSTSAYHELYKAENNADWTAVVTHAGATVGNQYGIRIDLTGDPNGTGNEFWLCRGNLTTRAAMRSNGGLANYQANDVNLSDERTKKDIAPLGSMWAKIKALEIVTFKYKDQTHDDDNIGLIAQQVESVAPEFIDTDGFGETPEDGVPLKTVYTTDMYHAAIKALQEAMARIESLEADVAALKGAK